MHGRTVFEEFDVLQQLRRSQRIFELLRESAGSELSVQDRLRREFPDDVVRAAFSLAELRQTAGSKFTRAGQMWFGRKGLEQSTSEAVARHKARRFHGRVWDYCCGIGGDAIALAEHGEVVAVDVDPAACLRAGWNAEVYGVSEKVSPVCADVEQLVSGSGLLHIDPDRRAGSRGRVVRVEDCVPGVEFLLKMTHGFSGGAIKLSPAGNFAGRFSNVEFELISLSGECKEATVWFGELAGDVPWRATVLPAGESLTGDPLGSWTEVGPLSHYLYDPDPAVVRAGLVDRAAEHLELRRLDQAEEYLTGEALVESPFVRPFRVVAELPNRNREIRRYFRESNIGQVEIKCRHIPIQAEAVRRKLPLTGSEPGVLVFARIRGKSRAVVCTRVASGGDPRKH